MEQECEIIMMPQPQILSEDDLDCLLMGMLRLLEQYGTVEQMLSFVQKIEDLAST